MTDQEQNNEEVAPPEFTPVELDAINLGWQPKEEFEADPKNEGKRWRSADDFMDRKPLFDKIEDLGRKVKNFEKAFQSLNDQSRRAQEIGYQRALDELRAAKKAALEDSDADKVVEIDEKIIDLKAEQKVEGQKQAQQIPQEFVDWVERNEWYKNDPKLRAAADGIGLQYIKEGLPPSQVLANLEQDMKDLFPGKFEKPRPKAPPSVESGSRKSNGTGNGAESVKSKMTGEELRIMKTIISTGLTEKEYLEQFVGTQPDRFKGVKL